MNRATWLPRRPATWQKTAAGKPRPRPQWLPLPGKGISPVARTDKRGHLGSVNGEHACRQLPGEYLKNSNTCLASPPRTRSLPRIPALPERGVLHMLGLPPGDYTFVFEIDDTTNGIQDDEVRSDSVQVTVQ